MTVGVTFVIIGLANFVFGPTMKPIPLPQALSGPIDIGFRTMPTHRLFVIACGLVTALALWLVIERTEFGVKLRASVDNSGMADALGIRTEIIYAVTFASQSGSERSAASSGPRYCLSNPFMRFATW